MKTRRRALAGSRGATVVEAAFALPVLFMLVQTFLDFGSWELQSTQAASAARDGARAAILHYSQADVSSSADYAIIRAAVKRRIPGQSITALTVTCVGPSTTTPLAGGCASAAVDVDRIVVGVSWTRQPWSLIGKWFGNPTMSGSATMTINGLPQ
jgi:Flp pilus assembly protein TadG